MEFKVLVDQRSQRDRARAFDDYPLPLGKQPDSLGYFFFFYRHDSGHVLRSDLVGEPTDLLDR